MIEDSSGGVENDCGEAPDGDPADSFSYEEVSLPRCVLYNAMEGRDVHGERTGYQGLAQVHL